MGRVMTRHAMRGAHEDFEESHSGAPEIGVLADLARPGVRGQTEVDQRAIVQVTDLVLQELECADGIAVSVLDHRRNPADRRR